MIIARRNATSVVWRHTKTAAGGLQLFGRGENRTTWSSRAFTVGFTISKELLNVLCVYDALFCLAQDIFNFLPMVHIFRRPKPIKLLCEFESYFNFWLCRFMLGQLLSPERSIQEVIQKNSDGSHNKKSKIPSGITYWVRYIETIRLSIETFCSAVWIVRGWKKAKEKLTFQAKMDILKLITIYMTEKMCIHLHKSKFRISEFK